MMILNLDIWLNWVKIDHGNILDVKDLQKFPAWNLIFYVPIASSLLLFQMWFSHRLIFNQGMFGHIHGRVVFYRLMDSIIPDGKVELVFPSRYGKNDNNMNADVE